jgi:hypothetical protein
MTGESPGSRIQEDPRWRRLKNRTWRCSSCNETHVGIFDIAYHDPMIWSGPKDYDPNSVVSTSSHFLSEDFCILGNEHHFIRCILEVPILGTGGERFGFGVWSSLSTKNFELYVRSFDDPHQDVLGPWFGWFSNRLRGYPDTLNLKCQVHPRSERRRPWIELEPTDHPLARDQRDGVTFDRLLEIYDGHGHNMRAALLD